MQDSAHNTRSTQSPTLVFGLFFRELFFGKSPSKREKIGKKRLWKAVKNRADPRKSPRPSAPLRPSGTTPQCRWVISHNKGPIDADGHWCHYALMHENTAALRACGARLCKSRGVRSVVIPESLVAVDVPPAGRPRKPDAAKSVSVRLTGEQSAWVAAASRQQGNTEAAVIRSAIDRAMAGGVR